MFHAILKSKFGEQKLEQLLVVVAELHDALGHDDGQDGNVKTGNQEHAAADLEAAAATGQFVPTHHRSRWRRDSRSPLPLQQRQHHLDEEVVFRSIERKSLFPHTMTL